MSLPETFEIDFRKPDVDTNIWLHICDWNFWDDAVLARLSSLLKTWRRKAWFSLQGTQLPAVHIAHFVGTDYKSTLHTNMSEG